MIVLLDTDILIDFALDRAPHADSASRLLTELEHRPGSGFMAWHSVANFFYLVAPSRGRQSTRSFILDLSRFISVAETTTESVRYAAHLPVKDFEDAMQVAAAVACGADVIATRNLRDYTKSPVRAAHPQTVIEEFA